MTMISMSAASSDGRPIDQEEPAVLPIEEGGQEGPRKSAAPSAGARKKPQPVRKSAAPVKTEVTVSAAKTTKAETAPLAKVSEPSSATAETPSAKPAKLKLVRDSFTIPRPEYDTIGALKTRALKLERSVKKSELLRAGLILLAGLGDAALLQAIDAVPQVKTGRPKKTKDKAEVSATQAAGKQKPAKS